jgi:hypothetical protein
LNQYQPGKKRKIFSACVSKENERKSNEVSKKPNLTTKEESQITKPFEICLVGTSMIKHIKPSDILAEKKCFFKSISGGLIKDVFEHIKVRKDFFTQNDLKMFITTCGSNDCDSQNEFNETLNNFLEFASHLQENYPNAILVFNTLVPRQKTKFTEINLFEEKRVCFNNFLKSIIKNIIKKCIIVDHERFESKSDLDTLLSDGVHLSPINGVPVYVQDIKKAISSFKF